MDSGDSAVLHHQVEIGHQTQTGSTCLIVFLLHETRENVSAPELPRQYFVRPVLPLQGKPQNGHELICERDRTSNHGNPAGWESHFKSIPEGEVFLQAQGLTITLQVPQACLTEPIHSKTTLWWAVVPLCLSPW